MPPVIATVPVSILHLRYIISSSTIQLFPRDRFDKHPTKLLLHLQLCFVLLYSFYLSFLGWGMGYRTSRPIDFGPGLNWTPRCHVPRYSQSCKWIFLDWAVNVCPANPLGFVFKQTSIGKLSQLRRDIFSVLQQEYFHVSLHVMKLLFFFWSS